jgi:hypothetical protein
MAHALVKQFLSGAAINALVAHCLVACSNIALHIEEAHAIISKVVTTKLHFTFVANIPAMIVIHNESVAMRNSALKN